MAGSRTWDALAADEKSLALKARREVCGKNNEPSLARRVSGKRRRRGTRNEPKILRETYVIRNTYVDHKNAGHPGSFGRCEECSLAPDEASPVLGVVRASAGQNTQPSVALRVSGRRRRRIRNEPKVFRETYVAPETYVNHKTWSPRQIWGYEDIVSSTTPRLRKGWRQSGRASGPARRERSCGRGRHAAEQRASGRQSKPFY